ncbi:MAG: 50S ribosomal protein L4 [Candidatus Zambryskibacteria bacterium CG10_big_fil_rev_8_21_14_0_10_42_12]|uniref:Large ribosomal subunit protein uL4 n=1 Tax=Candidatus Zambryskibacteria bacterium CG10_big_fil_rev_8_21_14_0_10_42_12 TaxID=1975115 RepID=A0A2H0QYF1_9BACT|nr:MAG: 50S ribosomal protein L4 [Candidatus Zambryskibacteria bacterium CG10_big_fil_rev_8_21_14_0_10_42_12]
MATKMESKIFTQDGKEAGTIALPEEIFGLPWNADLVHQVATSMMANAREGSANTKTRAEVRGGGKKPWRQKGTGRARHGSRRSPIWVGGGMTHGPRAEKNYSKKINKKMKTKALYTLLSAKYRDGELIFVDSFSFDAPKTKEARDYISNIAKVSKHNDLATKRKNAAVISIPAKNANVAKSFANIGSVFVDETRMLNPLELLNTKYVVLVSPDESIKILEGRKKVVKK